MIAAVPSRLTHRRPWLALLGLVGLAWGLWAQLGPAEGGVSAPELVADLLVGLLMQWAGLAVWSRAGSGRTGPLLYAAGVLWSVGSIWAEPPLISITLAWRGWYEPLLVAIVLGYPTARLVRGVDRVIVGALVAAFLVRSLSRMFLFDRAAFFGEGNPNPFAIPGNLGLWTAIEIGTVIVSVGVALALLARCLVRWFGASARARRTLTPVLVSGAAIAPLLGWTAFSNRFEITLPLPGELVFWSQMILRAVVPVAILLGVYRLQTARSGLADLLVALDRGVPVGGLERILRESLRDPSLRLLFPRSTGDIVDADGTPDSLPGPESSRGVTTITNEASQPIAYITHDPALAEDPQLLAAAGAAARLSLENERLQAEVRAQLEEVRASRVRLVEASDAERRRVERDLHDGAQQRLVTLALRLRMARDRSTEPDPVLTGLLADASAELDLALTELRELARGIHPAILTRSGLGQAVTALAERCLVPVSVAVATERCPAAVEATAYFVVAEALTNVVRYAGASSARVVAEKRRGQLHVEVSDDGVGGADVIGGTGLQGLVDRVAAVGGHLEIDSPAGTGTTIRVTLPCA